jgi:hypothetical protein
MDKIAFDQLPLVDLGGQPVNLTEHVQKYLLLIFLRHLA